MPRTRPTAFEVSFPDEKYVDDNATQSSQNTIGRKRELDGSSDHGSRGSKRRSIGVSLPRNVSRFHPREDEIRETRDLVIFGEDDEDENGDSKPIRMLDDFSIFDPNHDYEMVSLASLEEDDGVNDRNFEGEGVVSPIFENDEDEGQEDDLNAADQRIRLGAIIRFDFDFTKQDDPVYIETEHAWYMLRNPSSKYRRYFRLFFTPRKIVQLIISSALADPQRGYKDFLEEFLSLEVMKRPLTEGQLWDSIPELDLALEIIENPDKVLDSELISHFHQGRPGVILRRADYTTPRVPRPPHPNRALLKGSWDAEVLRSERQNPTHVTPDIAKIATGFFREHMVVVGPRPKPESEVPKYDFWRRIRDFVIRHEATQAPKIRVRPDYRLKPRSPWLRCVEIDGMIYSIGDVVVVGKGQFENKKAPNLPHSKDIPVDSHMADYFWFGKILNINGEEDRMHIHYFEHSRMTSLGEVSNPQELFYTDTCGSSIAFSVILGKVTVNYPDGSVKMPKFKQHEFFCRFVYNIKDGSFTDIDATRITLAELEEPPENCPVCLLVGQKNQELQWTKVPNGIAWHGTTYHINDFVRIKAEKGPCSIGQLMNVYFPANTRSEPIVTVKLFGRVDKLGSERPHNVMKDERHLFATNDKKEFQLSDLIGPCFVYHYKSLPDADAWLSSEPNHFHVKYRFPSLNVVHWNQKEELQQKDIHICKPCVQENLGRDTTRKDFLSRARQNLLRTFDPFGGAGSFGRGLEESGCIRVTHAVEISPSAADTLKHNSPHTIVYNQCANMVLQWAIKANLGMDVDPLLTVNGKRALPPPPKPGDIDCIIAGFPCQSHSQLNMYRKADDIKSNLILNVLSWIDFLDPKYCIFENVRGFLSYNLKAYQASEHKVAGGIEMGGLKFVMRAMVSMGYQVRVGLLQAAHYGTPQGRVRFFLVAAKHGYPLPEFPQPSHDFPQTDSLEIRFPNGHCVGPIITLNGTAPHSHVSIEDAIHDLPLFDWRNPDRVGSRKDEETGEEVKQIECRNDKPWCGLRGPVRYRHEPLTNFQKWCRREQTEDLQHYTRTYPSIKVKRVRSIPLTPKADYRDMPQELWEWQTANPNSARARQGFRPGLYGRLDKKELFPTTVTNVDPTAKQSKVLNPYCRRIVTVRDLARSQGFPDDFVFMAEGNNVKTMYRQIGNAVPWPISIALGRELRAALIKKWEMDREEAIDIDTD